jgi:Zn-finger protein
MHEFAKKLIEERIDKLISEWNFEVRKKYHPKECTCYSQDKKCHNIKDLNCLFCLCPHYYLNVEEGGCNKFFKRKIHRYPKWKDMGLQ